MLSLELAIRSVQLKLESYVGAMQLSLESAVDVKLNRESIIVDIQVSLAESEVVPLQLSFELAVGTLHVSHYHQLWLNN